jgi:hypothetical protein
LLNLYNKKHHILCKCNQIKIQKIIIKYNKILDRRKLLRIVEKEVQVEVVVVKIQIIFYSTILVIVWMVQLKVGMFYELCKTKI